MQPLSANKWSLIFQVIAAEWKRTIDLGLNGGRIAFWMTVLRRLLGGSMAYSMLVGIVERCHREGAD